MKKIAVKYIAYFVLFCLLQNYTMCFAQMINPNQGNTSQTDYCIRLPYENKNGALIVTVEIKGKSHRFIFDTGAITMINQTLFNEINPSILGKMKILDQSGKADSLKVVLLNDIVLDDINFMNIPTIVIDSSHFIDCLVIDGVIGSNLLRNSVVQFSTKDSTIFIASDIVKLNVKEKPIGTLKLDKQSNPYLWLKLGKVKTEFLFDSGDAGFIRLSYNHFDALKKRKSFRVIASSFGANTMGLFGVAEEMPVHRLYVPNLTLGKAKMLNVTMEAMNGTPSIGAELLQYGRLTLDYKQKKIYFNPYSSVIDISKPLWSVSPTIKNGKLVIGIIWDNSIEGLSIGDEILAINGSSLAGLTFCEIYSRPRLPQNIDKATLTIKKNDGSVHEVIIRAKAITQ